MKTRRILLPAALAGSCLLSLGACALSLASLFVLLSKHPEPARPASLQWSQLESSDADRYAENLRAIGCPAPTIQAILSQTASGDFASSSGASARSDSPAQAPTPASAKQPVATTVTVPASVPPAEPQTFAERRAAAIAAQMQRQAEAQSYAASSVPASHSAPFQPTSDNDSSTGVSNVEANSNVGYSSDSTPTSYAQGGSMGGTSSSAGYASAGSGVPSAAVQTIVAPSANSQIPAAFSDTPPSANPTAAQAHQLDGIQQQFANTVSDSSAGPGNTSKAVASSSGNEGNPGNTAPVTTSATPAPSTPTNTKQNWQNATWLADQQYKQQFGTAAFIQHQEQANHSGASQ
jgi:hypothetical protein